ncbi:MAG: ParB/RepB/Spo0J family partition protein [Gammaproteobacteria bacterium]|nr:ParB/RepB/Spo0J family partition protein [Gammaproteobacteria bacterium]
MAAKKRGLGRGLDALLGPRAKPSGDTSQQLLQEIPIECIRPGKYQPRKGFDERRLNEFANSIKSQGIIQPIVLRPLGDDLYEIVAGERRWRAAQLAELEKIPAVIRQLDDQSAVAVSLIENIQREDLNPWEESLALQRLVEEFDLTHQQVAEAVGKSRTAVTNMLRLANLSPGVVRLLTSGEIEMGHARALLSLDDMRQEAAASEIAARQLNVRQAEALVRKLLAEDSTGSKKVKQKVDADTQRLEERLSRKLGQSVSIRHTAKGSGKLTIAYNSLDELDGILGRFGDLD